MLTSKLKVQYGEYIGGLNISTSWDASRIFSASLPWFGWCLTKALSIANIKDTVVIFCRAANAVKEDIDLSYDNITTPAEESL